MEEVSASTESWAEVLTPPALAATPEPAFRARIWLVLCLVGGALAAGLAAAHLHDRRLMSAAAMALGAGSWIALAFDLQSSGKLARTTHASCALAVFLAVQSAVLPSPLTLPTLALFGLVPFLSNVGVKGRDSKMWSLSALPLPLITMSISGASPETGSTSLSLTFLFAGVGAMTWTLDRLGEQAREERDDALRRLAIAENRTGDLASSKQQFVKNVSHEFRTPLNHIMGAAQLLSETPLSEEQRDLLNIAERSGEDLIGIIDEAVDVHDLESGELRLERTWMDLHLILARASRNHSREAKKRNLRFSVEVDPAMPERLFGDPDRTEQILDNLLENALAFTSAGSIHVRATYLGGGALSFEVEDTGTGIDPSRHEEIFEAFRQVDESDTRTKGGLGAGLSLCRNLARLMGGDISVRSKLGKGSTFTFTTLLGVESATGSLPTGGDAVRHIRDARVLLAEPNPRTRKGFLGMLERMGLSAEGVDSQTALYGRFAERPYDVVFVDMELPGPNPLEQTIARIAEMPHRNHAFVVALCRSDVTGDMVVQKYAFDDHLPKPLRREQVLDILQQWAKRGDKERSA